MAQHIFRKQPVVGLYFRDAATKTAVNAAVGGTYPAKLVRAPTNPKDPDAVEVHAELSPGQWFQIGFLPAACSALAGYWLQAAEPHTSTLYVEAGSKLPSPLLDTVIP